MKVKTWHVGCLVVLIAAALYFLLGTREGLDNPACPVGAPGISSVTQSGGQNIRLYTQSECSAMGGNFARNGKKNWGMANDSVGECIGTTNGINVGFCNQSAPPSAAAKTAVGGGSSTSAGESSCWGNLVDASTGSFISQAGENSGMGAIGTGPKYTTSADAQAACASDSTCKGVMKTKIPTGVGQQSEPGYIKYTGPPEIVPRPGFAGIPAGALTFLPKIPCSSSTTPPTASPMPPDPTGPMAGASMTPSVPAPSQAPPPSYSLTCTAAPVSGMKGSVGMPETPAAWNVSQPPSGWNSKNGYTTTGF